MTITHDQDVLRAIKSQAKLGGTPISEAQIQHVYDIGRRSQGAYIDELLAEIERLRDPFNWEAVWWNDDPPTILDHGNLIELDHGTGQVLLRQVSQSTKVVTP